MFSFFRKKSAYKETKPEQQPTGVKEERKEDEEDKKIGESSKKRIKGDKKTSKDKKGSFKRETETVNVSSDNSSTSNVISQKVPENTPQIALIAEETNHPAPSLVDYVDHSEVGEIPSQSDGFFLLQEEPPDEFCEAQEVILPEFSSLLPLTLTQSNQLLSTDGAIPESTCELGKDLPEPSKDKQPSVRRVSFNCKDIVIDDPDDVNLSAIPDATHKLPIMLTQRDLDEVAVSSAPFLSAEESPLHDLSSIIYTAFILSSRIAQN